MNKIIFILLFISACSSNKLKHLDGASVAPVKKHQKHNSIELKELESKKKKPTSIHLDLNNAHAICTPYLKSVFEKNVLFSYAADAYGFNNLMNKRGSMSAYEWSIFKMLNKFNFERESLITKNFKSFFEGLSFEARKTHKVIDLTISIGKGNNTSELLFIDHQLPKLIRLPNIKKSCQQMKKILKGYLSENN